jgi:uncharacterized protein
MSSQPDIIQFLSNPIAYGVGVEHVEIITTHISYIFLAGEKAFKLKREVSLPYLDFSTFELRRAACNNEVRLNKRTAPNMYLGTAPVTKNAAGELAIDGEGAVVDWLVEMRRFESDMLLSEVAQSGQLTSNLIEELATQIYQFHTDEEPIEDAGGAVQIAGIIENNAKCFAKYGRDILDDKKVEKLNACLRKHLIRHAQYLDQRRDAGAVRHCHGDLHLNNIVLIESKPVLFDAIEFSDDLATIDTIYDLAFLLMDMSFQGLRAEANQLMNHYFSLASDETSLAVLPLFLSLRASIRSHVAALAKERVSAIRYLDHALTCLNQAAPRLVAIGGLSGTGKSSVARHILPYLPVVPGALVLRSDVIRKRLAGIGQYQKLPEESYSNEMTRRTYDRMFEVAKNTLGAGHSVIVDAVFAQPSERAAIVEVANEQGVEFDGFWLEVEPSVAAARIVDRKKDASDATVEVLKNQLKYDIGVLDWHRVPSNRILGRVAEQVLQFLRLKPEET